MKYFIVLLFCLSLNAQTINEISSDYVDYLKEYDFWFTSPAAGDSSKFYFEKFEYESTKNLELAIEYFKYSYSFAQKNDRYNLSNKALLIVYCRLEINNNNHLKVKGELEAIRFANERNIYAKKFIKMIDSLLNEIDRKMSQDAITEASTEERTNWMMLSFNSSLIYTPKFREEEKLKSADVVAYEIDYIYNFEIFELGISYLTGSYSYRIPKTNGYQLSLNGVNFESYSIYARKKFNDGAGLNPFIKLGFGYAEFIREKYEYLPDHNSSQLIIGVGVDYFASGESNFYFGLQFDYYHNFQEIYFSGVDYYLGKVHAGFALTK